MKTSCIYQENNKLCYESIKFIYDWQKYEKYMLIEDKRQNGHTVQSMDRKNRNQCKYSKSSLTKTTKSNSST